MHSFYLSRGTEYLWIVVMTEIHSLPDHSLFTKKSTQMGRIFRPNWFHSFIQSRYFPFLFSPFCQFRDFLLDILFVQVDFPFSHGIIKKSRESFTSCEQKLFPFPERLLTVLSQTRPDKGYNEKKQQQKMWISVPIFFPRVTKKTEIVSRKKKYRRIVTLFLEKRPRINLEWSL
jgi:hypothetical protein